MSRQPRIGQRLAAARLRRGLSQSAVAHDAGIAPSYLSRIETGKVQPTYRTLVRVARAIGMHFEELGEFEPGALAGRCPVSENGQCLLDMIRNDVTPARERNRDFFTVRQVKLLRRFARWLRHAPADRLSAVESLLEDLSRAQGVESDPAEKRSGPAPTG